MEKFSESEIKLLNTATGGSVMVIGGSHLFHGAPLLALKTVSREAKEAFFASPEKSVGEVALKMKSKLFSFIWVPWEEVEVYIKKCPVILIGPGFMRCRSEKDVLEYPMLTDEAWKLSKSITEDLLTKFKDKKWVIDAGSLQVIEPKFVPEGAILTPNKMEYEMLFNSRDPEEVAKKYKCTLLVKGKSDFVYSGDRSMEITGGNEGMVKGGTGDTLAGLVTALYAKNDAFLSAIAASHINKEAGDMLFKEKGPHFNADDLVDKIPEVLKNFDARK